MRANGLTRAGAALALATFFAEHAPDVAAVVEIDAGDALALATRFGLQWAHRGGVALFWTRRFVGDRVEDGYLPFDRARPFERRGFLRADVRDGDRPLTLYATDIPRLREGRIRGWRFARARVRTTQGPVLAFIGGAGSRIGLADLGVGTVEHDPDLYLAAREVRIDRVARATAI